MKNKYPISEEKYNTDIMELIEGDLKDEVISLRDKLKPTSCSLTTYMGGSDMARVWAIYNSNYGRPRYRKDCLIVGGWFSNLQGRKSRKCGAYKELKKIEKELQKQGIIDK